MKSLVGSICKVVTVILFGGILLLAGSLIGMQSERTRLVEQQQEGLVTDIAIVNLDEGIFVSGEKIYYSTELISMDENFVADNLESARQGISKGIYAAYIIIPADFSQRATSINSVPEKAVLEFAVNPNLREDISRMTMSNIKNFEIALNTNMSYMYVQAILEEFHDVQDKSEIILNNDTNEMNRINDIEPQDVIVDFAPDRVEPIKAEIEEADFDGAIEKNRQIVTSMNENHEKYVGEVVKSVSEIEKQKVVVSATMDSYVESVQSFDVKIDVDGNPVYENGINHLYEHLEDYDANYNNQMSYLEEAIKILKGENQPESSENGEETTEVPYESIEKIIKNERELVTNKVNSELIEYSNQMSTFVSEVEVFVEKMKNDRLDSADIDNLEIAISNSKKEIAKRENGMFTIDKLFTSKVSLGFLDELLKDIKSIPRADAAYLSGLFQTEVIEPIETEIEFEAQKMQDTQKQVTEAFDGYITKTKETKWDTLYDSKTIGTLFSEFNKNVLGLEEQVTQTHNSYETFVHDSVADANETVQTIQGDLQNAYDGTVENINQEVATAKQNRESMNTYNQSILGTFKEKLPYTRIGQLEYVQAYDFMVKPIKVSDSSVEKDKTIVFSDISILSKIIVIMSVCLFVCVFILLYLRVNNHGDEEFEVT